LDKGLCGAWGSSSVAAETSRKKGGRTPVAGVNWHKHWQVEIRTVCDWIAHAGRGHLDETGWRVAEEIVPLWALRLLQGGFVFGFGLRQGREWLDGDSYRGNVFRNRCQRRTPGVYTGIVFPAGARRAGRICCVRPFRWRSLSAQQRGSYQRFSGSDLWALYRRCSSGSATDGPGLGRTKAAKQGRVRNGRPAHRAGCSLTNRKGHVADEAARTGLSRISGQGN